jgi:hypothetical protein
MYQIKPMPGLRKTWGLIDDSDHPLILLEVKAAPPECAVRRYRESHELGRGEVITKFLGQNSFENACDWILREAMQSNQNRS